jgi:hypothetical protein
MAVAKMMRIGQWFSRDGFGGLSLILCRRKSTSSLTLEILLIAMAIFLETLAGLPDEVQEQDRFD